MSCERAKELMIDALVEPLVPARQRELEEHLASCEACAAEAAGYERLWRNLTTVAIPEPHPESAARLELAVADEFGVRIGAGSARPEPGHRGPLWRIAAAVLLVAAGSLATIGVQSFRSGAGDAAIVDRSRYVIVMTETRETPELSERAQEDFDAWIAGLIDDGVMETGFGLADRPPVGMPPGGSLMDLAVSGFIVIRAADAEDARRIALSSPVVEYGGSVEVRELAGNDANE